MPQQHPIIVSHVEKERKKDILTSSKAKFWSIRERPIVVFVLFCDCVVRNGIR